jgi:hypothetical protein
VFDPEAGATNSVEMGERKFAETTNAPKETINAHNMSKLPQES